MNDKQDKEIFDEGLLDRIIDTIAGKSAKGGQFAKNLKAYVDGDVSAIKNPEQVDNLRKFERNIDRIKQKFDKLVQELGTDLTSAIGTPDEGPFKSVIDEFDSAVAGFHAAINTISVEIDKVDDTLPPPVELNSSQEELTPKEKPKQKTKSSPNKTVLDDKKDSKFGFDDDGVFRSKSMKQDSEDTQDTGSSEWDSESWSLDDWDPGPTVDWDEDLAIDDTQNNEDPFIDEDDWRNKVNDQQAALSESAKQTLETWQKIIS